LTERSASSRRHRVSINLVRRRRSLIADYQVGRFLCRFPSLLFADCGHFGIDWPIRHTVLLVGGFAGSEHIKEPVEVSLQTWPSGKDATDLCLRRLARLW
jgi:hypothetical protein